MASTCPRCDAEIQPDDRFCPTCGQALSPDATTTGRTEFTPLSAPKVRRSTRRHRRRPWFRRWRVMVPLVLIGMILLTLGAGAWYIKTRFDTLNELSTPPPEISGDRLGGDEELTIDTGPAQDAIREAEARREAARNNPPPTLAPTGAPGAAGGTEAPGEGGQLAQGDSGGDRDARADTDGNLTPDADANSNQVPPRDTSGNQTPQGDAQGDPDVQAGAEGTRPAQGDANGNQDAQGSGEVGSTTQAGRADGERSGDTVPPQIAAGLPQSTAVIEVNPQGTPVLVSEPIGTPTLAQVPEPVEKDSYAFLMMGVDARPGEPIDVGVRPDSLFVVYLDGDNGSCRVLSIPRDTRTTLPGYGQSKINHALAVGGVPYEQLVVENLLGIELQHYGLIDFAGVEQLVDAVGGITVSNDFAFSTSGHDFPEGRIELNGEEALAYSRYRGGPDGDFGRQERQQAVVRALLTRGAGMDVVTAVPRLLDSVEDHVRTDLGPDDMVDIAQDFRTTCNGDTLATERIEGDVAWAFDDLMAMELSFVLVDPAEVREKVNWLLTGSDEPAPAPAVPAPPASPVASPAVTPEPSRPRPPATPTEPAG